MDLSLLHAYTDNFSQNSGYMELQTDCKSGTLVTTGIVDIKESQIFSVEMTSLHQ